MYEAFLVSSNPSTLDTYGEEVTDKFYIIPCRICYGDSCADVLVSDGVVIGNKFVDADTLLQCCESRQGSVICTDRDRAVSWAWEITHYYEGK